MEYEKVKDVFSRFMADPTGTADEAGEILTDLESVFSELNTVKKRVGELEETNQRLFLSLTGNAPEDETSVEDEKTGLEAIEEFWNEIDKEED